MKKLCALILLGGWVWPCATRAVDFKQAKFTQVVNSVEVISADKARRAAGVNDIFKMPDVLRTGPGSRAELVADDNTITRVGANTIFSFDPANRTIDLQQGSLLFHSPHGKGGGTIHTGSATASVLGTTIIVTTTPNGGFKVLVLEGEAKIRFLNGMHLTLTPGQMTFVLPGGGTSPVVIFRLDQETKGSQLVNGFSGPLPSWLNINTEITRQLLLLLNNKLQDVDLVVGDNATPNAVQVRMDILPQGQPSPFDTDSSIIGTDHTLNQPLPVNYPPLDPAHLQNGPFPYPGVPSFTGGLLFLGIINPSAGFVGNNIDIDTGLGTPIDLTAFAGSPDYDIMAKGDLRIWQSVIFGGTPTEVSIGSGVPDAVTLFAGGHMLVAQDSTLEADTKLFGLVADSFGVLDTTTGLADAGNPNALLNVSLINLDGDVDLLSLSDLTIEGMNSGYTVQAGGEVNIESEETLSLGSISTINKTDGGHNVAIDAYGSAHLTAQNDLDLYDTEVVSRGGDVILNSITGSINVKDVSYLNASGMVSLDAAGNVDLNNSDLQAVKGDVAVYADGDIGALYTTFEAGGNVDIEAGGVLTMGVDPQAYDVSITAKGSVTLSAGGDAKVYDTYINAGGDVNVSSGEPISSGVLKAISDGGNVDLEYSKIYAGDNGNVGQPSTTGGTVNINAYNGDVTLSSDYIRAYSGNSSSGNVNIYGSGTVDVETTSIYAGGDANIESGGTVTLGTGVTVGRLNVGYNTAIFAAGDVKLTAGLAGDLNAGDTAIYAGDNGSGGMATLSGGSITTDAGGNVNINSHSSLTAYGGTVGHGDVTVQSGGDTSIYTSMIKAGGSVGIEAGGVLNVGLDTQSEEYDQPYVDDVSITAIGSATLSAGGDANIYNTYINAGGDVDISSGGTVSSAALNTISGGNIDLEYSTVYAGDNGSLGQSSTTGGAVNIYALNGNVYLSGDNIYAYGAAPSMDRIVNNYAAGNVNINAGGFVDIEYSGINQDGSVFANAGGYVNLDNVFNDRYDSSSSDTYLTDWNITAGSQVEIGADANVQIYNSSIYANDGDVDITSEGSAAGAGTGTGAGGGDIAIGNSYIQAWNSVNVTAGDGSVSIDNGSTLLTKNGDVKVTAMGGGIDLKGNSVLQAIGSVYLTADGNININSSPISATVGIVPLGGSASSGDTVSISAGGTVTINGEYGNYKNFFYDIGGDKSVSISGGSEVDINNAWIQTLEGASLANAVEISSGGDVTVDDSFIGSSGDVSVQGGGTLSVNAGRGFATTVLPAVLNNFDIHAGGKVTLDGGTSASVVDTTIYGGMEVGLTGENGNVLVEDADILTGVGNVNIRADHGNLTLDSGTAEHGVTITANGTANLNAGGNISISDASITANSGNVLISTPSGVVDLENSTINAAAEVTSVKPAVPVASTGNVTVNAGAGITVNGASINGDGAAGTIALNSSAGRTTIENGASAQSFYLNVNSPDGILIDGTSGGGVHLSGNTINLKGSYTDSNKGITLTGTPVNPVDVSSFATVNMSAHTINLSFVGFGAGSYDNFHTFYGALAANPNTGSAPQSGYLNFVNGVTYAGTLITSGNQSTYVNPAGGPGIYVSHLPP